MEHTLYLLRHGIAEEQRPGKSDADRALTPEGIQKTKQAARGMRALGIRPDQVLSSPLTRARETAEIICEELRPGLEFAGAYAGEAFWYQDDRVVVFEGGDFGKSPDTFPIDCDQILRVGMYEGVPVFSVISASRPLDVIFIPVRPGVWHRYERGFRRTP